MAQPLAMLVYERALPGTQLVTQLEDRGYRVVSLSELGALTAEAEREKPMIAVVDLGFKTAAACEAIANLRHHSPTAHIPVIALTAAANAKAQEAALAAGATLAVPDSAILLHLDQFLEQALEV
jgi:CheY-like chemotaxis protein